MLPQAIYTLGRSSIRPNKCVSGAEEGRQWYSSGRWRRGEDAVVGPVAAFVKGPDLKLLASVQRGPLVRHDLLGRDGRVAVFRHCRTLLAQSAITLWFAGDTLHELLSNNTLVHSVSGCLEHTHSSVERHRASGATLATLVRHLATLNGPRTGMWA